MNTTPDYQQDDQAMRNAIAELSARYKETVVVQRTTEFANWGGDAVVVEANTYRIHVIDKEAVCGCKSVADALEKLGKALEPQGLLDRAAQLEAEAAKLRELAKEPEVAHA